MRRTREIDKQPDPTGGGGNKGLRADAMWGSDELNKINKSDEEFLREILGPTTGTLKRPYNLQLSSSSGSNVSTPTSHIKKRRRLLPEETACLVAAFEASPKPSKETQDRLAGRLRMSPRAIQIWFQNRRAKARRDAADAGKATLSFTPQPKEPPAKTTTPSARRLEPSGATLQERQRFEELFEMPVIPDTALHSDLASIMLQQHSRQLSNSTASSGLDSGTPLTWEDPAEWSKHDWTQWSTETMSAEMPTEGPRRTETDWMDAFLES